MANIVDVPGYGNIQFPDEMSRDEISNIIRNKILKQPEPTKEEPGAFGRIARGFTQTAQSMYESGKAGIESTFEPDIGKKAEIFRKAQEREEKRSKEEPSSLSLDKITEAYKKGILPAAGEVLHQIPEAVGSAAASMIGAPVGAIVGGIAAPGVGAIPGAMVGMGATSFLSQYGQNLQRQYEEQIKRGEKFDPQELKAAGWAAASAALDVGAFKIPFGKLFGKIGTESAEKLAKESVAKSLAKGAVIGPLAEVPTEVAQQMMERYQAGMDLTSDDAIKEYNETAAQVLMGMFPLGAAGRYAQRGRAKAELAGIEQQKQEAAQLAQQQSQYLAGRGAEAEQADIARQAKERAEAEEAASAEKPMLALPAPTPTGYGPPSIGGIVSEINKASVEQRDNQFVVVSDDGRPIQAGFRTEEEANDAANQINQTITDRKEAEQEQSRKEKLGSYVDLANKISRAGSVPIYFGEINTGLAAKIFNRRTARQGQSNVLDTNAPFTTPQEIQALELNEDRDLTIVQNKKNGTVELKSGGPKPGELNLSERLLQGQEPGINVAEGLAVRQEEEAAPAVEEERKPALTPVAEKYLDDIQDRNDPTKFTPKNTDKVTNQLKSIAQKNDIDLKKTVTKEGVETTVDKTPQDIVDELVAKRNRPIKMAAVPGEAAKEPYGPQPRPPRTAQQIGFEKAQARDRIKSAIKTAFDNLGLTKQGIKPDVVSYIADESGKPTRGSTAVAGEFNPSTKTITLASDIYDPNLSVEELTSKMMDVVNHEVVHALKQAGLFSPKEWNILENYVKNGDGRKFLERAKIQYPDLNMSKQIEEAIAEAAREFDAGNFKPVGAPRGLIKRIVDFFKGLFSAAKSNNTTPDQIFNAIRTGEIGERLGTPQAGGTMQSRIGDNGGPPLVEKKNWINVPRLLQFLGKNMYKKNIAEVASKELVQNAFDSIKSAQAQGLIVGPGKILFKANTKDNSITITDNGIGMDEDILRKAFFTIFGSEKRGLDPKERSGGFGLAKLAYILASEKMKIETTKNGVTYIVNTSGKDIKTMYVEGTDIKIEKKNTPDKPNGTIVYVKIPNESIDKMSGQTVKNSVEYPEIMSRYSGRKFIGNAKFYEYNRYSDKYEEVEELTDLSGYNAPITKKFSWGEVDVYTGKKLEKYGKSVQVMSAGIYQFDRSISNMNYESPKIKSIYNVKPYNTPAPIDLEEFLDEEGKVKEGQSSVYPFNPDRESFTEFVKKDISTLDKIIWDEYKDLSAAEEVKAMSSFFIMEKEGFNKVDIGLSDIDIENKNFVGDKSKFPSEKTYFHNNLNVDIIGESGVNPDRARNFFFELGQVVHDFAFKKLDEVANFYKGYEAYGRGEEKRIAGISLDKSYAGVNTRIPMNGMFMNPFYDNFFKERNIKLTPAGMAGYWMRIVKHEAAHEIARGHDNKFAGEEVILETMLEQVDAQTNGETVDILRKRMENIYEKYRNEYEAMKDVYDRNDTKNNSPSIDEGSRVSERLEGEDRRQASRSGNEYGPRREGQAVGPEVQEGREGGFYVPKGMSIEAEGVTDSGIIRKKNGDVMQSRVSAPRLAPQIQARQTQITPELTNPRDIEIYNGINKDLERIKKHLSPISEKEGMKMNTTYMDYVKEFFNPYHTLGKGADIFRIARAMMSGRISEISARVKEISSDIAAAKKDRENIFRYMTTRNADPSTIVDAKARKAAIEAKQLINKISDELVERKLITPGEREKYRDEYLHRTYLAYFDKKRFIAGGTKPGMGYYLKSREELTPEQRASLGEIEDPAFLVMESIFAPLRDLSILNYFEKLNKLGNGKWILGMGKNEYTAPSGIKLNLSLPELKSFAENLQSMLNKGEIARDRESQALSDIRDMNSFIQKRENELNANVDRGNYIQMPTDKDRYGPLAGLWIARPIYRDIMGMGSFLPNNMSGLAALFADGTLMSKANRWFKASKVAMNPPTIATNIISNALMMHMADVPMHRILPLTAQMLNEIVIKKSGKYYELAKKYGLKETTLSETELKVLYRELENRKSGGSDLNKMMNMFRALGDSMSNLESRAADFYGGIETVFKSAIIKDAIERQGLSEEEAVLKANKYLFDYSEVHDSIKYIRNMPFGAPFITWSYKMAPLLIETALTKPWKFAPYAAMYFGIASLASMGFAGAGGSDEDKDKLKKYLSKYNMDNPFVLVTSPTTAVDFGKFLPFTPMYNFGSKMAQGNIVDAFKSIGFFGGPLADIAVVALTGKDPFTGRDVVPKGSTEFEKFVMNTNYIANTFMPSFMRDLPQLAAGAASNDPELVARSSSITADALKMAFEGPKGKAAGLPVKDPSDLVKNFFGINTYHPSIEQFRRNALTLQKELNEITTEFNRTMKQPDLSPIQRKVIIDKYTELRKEKMKEIGEFYKNSNLSPAILKVIQDSVTRQ